MPMQIAKNMLICDNFDRIANVYFYFAISWTLLTKP